MVLPKTPGRSVGVERCSRLLYETLSSGLLEGVQTSATSSVYSRDSTLSELTTAQSVVLAVMHCLLVEDLQLCGLLLRMYSSVEQLRSSYLGVWLRDDFDFPEEDVFRVLCTAARVCGDLAFPDHLVRVFRGLAEKYPAAQRCQRVKDFKTLQFLAAGSQISGLNEDGENGGIHTRREDLSTSNSNLPKIMENTKVGDDSCSLNGGARKFIFKRTNFKGVTSAPGSYSIAKSSSDSVLHWRNPRARRKDAFPPKEDKEEPTLRGQPPVTGNCRAEYQRTDCKSSQSRLDTTVSVEVTGGERCGYVFSRSSSARCLRTYPSVFASPVNNLTNRTSDEVGARDRCGHPFSRSSSAMSLRVCGVGETSAASRQTETVSNEFAATADLRRFLKIAADASESELKKALDSEDLEGRTPLERASFEGRLDMVQSLLDLGVDSNSRKGKVTAVHLASERGHLKMLQLLLEGGADLAVATVCKKTAVHFAAERGHDFCLSWLLFHGADIEGKDISWQTPLHKAAGGGHLETVRVLLGNRAALEAEDRFGRRALHLAAKNGRVDTAVLLLDCGSDPEATDKKGHTPLFYAKEGGHGDVVEALLLRGASEG